tara:strand:- start:187 stop:423 length:237 start_codon:yes stop_codon:yes gene_type:complete
MKDPRESEPPYRALYTCLLCNENDFEELPEDGKCVCDECREYGDWNEYFDKLENKEPNYREEPIEVGGDYLYELKAGK